MPRSARKQTESNTYHIFIRGVGRQLIFEDDQDREMFLELIDRFMGRDVNLLAWVLMGNHVHLIVQGEMKCISSFMRKLETSYSGYFNRRHDRAGHLFQGRFGSEAIEDDQQLLVAIRYVHQNPAKAGLSDSCKYEWSSYDEYVGEPRNDPILRDTASVLDLFGGITQFEQFHAEKGKECLLDIEGSPRRYERMSDAQALRISTQILGEGWVHSLANYNKADRDEKLRMLKGSGLSIRQIERLTGIGRGIIQRS